MKQYTIDDKLRKRILKRDHYTCQRCWFETAAGASAMRAKSYTYLHVHHILARSMGGTDDPKNLITLCHFCHHIATMHGALWIPYFFKVLFLEVPDYRSVAENHGIKIEDEYKFEEAILYAFKDLVYEIGPKEVLKQVRVGVKPQTFLEKFINKVFSKIEPDITREDYL